MLDVKNAKQFLPNANMLENGHELQRPGGGFLLLRCFSFAPANKKKEPTLFYLLFLKTLFGFVSCEVTI
jgi:hypothetical protein